MTIPQSSPKTPGRGRGDRRAIVQSLRVRLAVHRDEVVALGRRSRQVVLFAAMTGALTGLGVAGFESATRTGLFDHLRRAPLAAQVLAPLVGLVLAAMALRFVAGGASPATADEYIKNFHETGARLDLRPVAGRLVASMATLGFGGAMGYEGPSIYLGAAVGLRYSGASAATFPGWTPRSLWWPAPRPGSRPSLRHRPPGWCSPSRSLIRRISLDACCCPPGSRRPSATSSSWQ